MIKIILLVTSLAFSGLNTVSAQDMVFQGQLNMKIRKSASYQTAFKAFKSGDFEKSFKLFGKLSNKHRGNEHVDFYYGRSAFELKKYELAFSAFDRVLISNESNHRARLELARTLFLMEAYKESKKEFEKVLLAPIPLAVRTQVNKFLKMVEEKESGYILNKVAMFGIGWDNNINNNSYLNSFLYNGNLATITSNDKEDYNFRVIVVGNLIVPFKKNNKLSSESTVVAFLQEQNKYKENNLFVTSLSTGLGYIQNGYKSLTSFTYDHIWIGGKQNMYFYGLSFNFKTKIKKIDMFTLDIKIKEKKMFHSEDDDKDSRIMELGLAYAIPINKDKLVLSSIFTKESKDGGNLYDIDKTTTKLKVSYNKKLFSRYDTSLDYQWEQNKYGDKDPALKAKRDDKVHNITLRIARKIDKKKTVSLDFSNIKCDSNINMYSYKKQSVLLNYTILF